jgi:radical SAM protein with 4Fe4S-binding SPASM domain
MDYIDRVERVDVEQVLDATLGAKFGEKFRTYRRDYHRSLNYDKNGYLPDFPITVGLELVNRCNLSCIMCYTVNHTLPKATLDRTTIAKIMHESQARGLSAVQIGLGSEALLYKNIGDVLAAADGAGIMDIFLATNGVLLKDKVCEAIIRHRVSRVFVSLDAATCETYKRIRGKDELELIESNIHRLIDAKRRHGARLPLIRVSFCVQKENLHEREMFAAKWRDVVDHVDFQVMSDFSEVDELAETGKATEPKVYNASALDTPYCPQPFNRLDVWSNGDVTPCCTFYGKNLVLGNVKTQSLKEIWDGAKINDLRNQFRSGKLNPNCEMCLAGRDVETFAKVG